MATHRTLLKVKAIEADGERVIEGWATTGREDRVGDVVVPEGARFTLPLPLLFAHRHEEPIGAVIAATVTRAGIRIRARLTEGVARAEEVWRLVQDGALTAVSVGFAALKTTPLVGGGLRFDEWDWHELSIVSVPANADARITVGKCLAVASTTPRPTTPATPAAPSPTLNPILAAQANALEIGGNESDALAASIRAAAKMLPPEVADLVDVGRSSSDPLGKTFYLASRLGTELATVTKGGEIKLAPGVLEPTSKATEKGLTAAQRAEVGEMLVELAQIISGTIRKEGLTPLRERVEKLETSR